MFDWHLTLPCNGVFTFPAYHVTSRNPFSLSPLKLLIYSYPVCILVLCVFLPLILCNKKSDYCELLSASCRPFALHSLQYTPFYYPWLSWFDRMNGPRITRHCAHFESTCNDPSSLPSRMQIKNAILSFGLFIDCRLQAHLFPLEIKSYTRSFEW